MAMCLVTFAAGTDAKIHKDELTPSLYNISSQESATSPSICHEQSCAFTKPQWPTEVLREWLISQREDTNPDIPAQWAAYQYYTESGAYVDTSGYINEYKPTHQEIHYCQENWLFAILFWGKRKLFM